MGYMVVAVLGYNASVRRSIYVIAVVIVGSGYRCMSSPAKNSSVAVVVGLGTLS